MVAYSAGVEGGHEFYVRLMSQSYGSCSDGFLNLMAHNMYIVE